MKEAACGYHTAPHRQCSCGKDLPKMSSKKGGSMWISHHPPSTMPWQKGSSENEFKGGSMWISHHSPSITPLQEEYTPQWGGLIRWKGWHVNYHTDPLLEVFTLPPHSTRNPYGIHIIPGGFHPFHIEYVLGDNPSHFGDSIPPIFHMECYGFHYCSTWIPCGFHPIPHGMKE